VVLVYIQFYNKNLKKTERERKEKILHIQIKS